MDRNILKSAPVKAERYAAGEYAQSAKSDNWRARANAKPLVVTYRKVSKGK